MLQELSYRKKIPSVDILTMECVASCNTTITKSDPKTTIGQLSAMFKNIALPKEYGITRESLKSLYDHSFDGDIDFAALSVITDILNKGIILSHWADAHTIVDKTSVIAAPIEINNERYYAVLISGKKKSEFKYPYVMRVFRLYAKEGDVVYDPFMGTGTTAVACKNKGLHYIGSEISEKQCKYAEERLNSIE